MMRRLCFALALLLASLGSARAQQSTNTVTQTATPNANYQVLCSAQPAVNTATACTTPTPASNAHVYVTAVYFDVCTDGTGSAQTNVSYTLTGAAGFASAAAIATYSMAASAEICQHWGYSNGGGVLFVSQPGTPITITPPAAVTHNSTSSTVFGYIAQ
jgi:hypothetical protein